MENCNYYCGLDLAKADNKATKVLTLSTQNFEPIISFNWTTGEFLIPNPELFSKVTLKDFTAYARLLSSFMGEKFKVYTVKNYSGYTVAAFSSYEKAEEYLRANDKGDKDLCISPLEIN